MTESECESEIRERSHEAGPLTMRQRGSARSYMVKIDKEIVKKRKSHNIYKGKNYIPKDNKLRRDILKMFHDHETARHPGELETYNSV